MDSAANPYLAFSVLLAAGLKGIKEEYELPAEAEHSMWALTDAERRSMGFDPLPMSLEHALAVMERSELVAETLGEQVFSSSERSVKKLMRTANRSLHSS